MLFSCASNEPWVLCLQVAESGKTDSILPQTLTFSETPELPSGSETSLLSAKLGCQGKMQDLETGVTAEIKIDTHRL